MSKQKLNRSLAGLVAACSAFAVQAQQPTGQWDFENGDLAGTVGAALTYQDGPGGATEQATSFNTTTGFGIPDIGGSPAKVIRVGAYQPGSGLVMPTPENPNGGSSSYVNDYTLIMDILFPAESNSKLRAILESDLGGINADAELFVTAGNGLGTKTQSFGTIAPGTWNRVVFVVDANDDPASFTGTIRTYINGVEVGAQNIANLKDDRYALNPAQIAYLFSDDDAETAVAYVNSLQLRDQALSKGQVLALGAATSAGIPQELPPVPSGIDKWIPAGELANRSTPVGAVISTGSTTIQDNTIAVLLNGVVQVGPTITRQGDLITVRTAPLNLTPGTKYTLQIAYNDSLAGNKTFTREFTAAVFFEDFESIVLGPGLEENHAADVGWANTPPTGWTVDNSQMAGFNSPDDDGDGRPDNDGRSEWFGWAFAHKDWWTRADLQRREEFALATGTVAIADPDEWDDSAHEQGLFNSFLTTPSISLAGVAANSAFVSFVSSWRPEARDDGPPSFPEGNINNQTAIINASFDGGAPVQIFKWDSVEGSPTFHADFPNESVLIPLNNPAGAQNVVLTFAMVEAANDWWWAVDNIGITAGASAPTITRHPVGGHYSVGGKLTMSVTATGTEPFTYEWRRNNEVIPGQTGSTLNIDFLESNAGGTYTVKVTNVAGSADSNGALVELSSSPISTALVAHLKFDDNLEDATTRNNDGQAVGAPVFTAGKLGQAVQIPSGSDYVTLGRPADLNFGTDTDFSISFWALVNGLDGDPSIIGNKDWDSGGNPGWVVFSAGNRRIDWNLAGAPGARKDSDGVGNVFTNDTWKHVVITFDRNGNSVIYVDGVAVNTTPLSANANNLDTPEGFNTNIGQDGAGDYGSFFTDLRVDDLGIWHRVLTPQEAQSIFAAGNAGKDLSQATFEPPAAVITGQWDFDAGDLSATIGSPLQYRGETQAGTTFQTLNINGQPAKVMAFPAADPTQGYIMTHGAAANGGGQFVNDYTLIMDVMFPAESNSKWRGLFQTSESNGNDGDLFVNNGNGIGISGNYSGTVLPDTWHRIAFVVDLTKSTLSKYIDGALVGSQNITGIDGRFSLGATALLFTDEDNETATGFVNSIQFRRGAMRTAEIAALGGATAGGIGGGGTPEQISLTIIRRGNNSFEIGVSTPGTYQLQRKENLTAPWENVGSPSDTGIFNVPRSGDAAFYQVQKL